MNEEAMEVDTDLIASIRPTRFGGNCYLLRKCRAPAVLGGIHVPEKTQQICDFFTVIRAGHNVGKRFGGTKQDRRLIGGESRPRCKHLADMELKAGDMVMLEGQNHGIHRIPGTETFYLADEGVILAKIERN